MKKFLSIPSIIVMGIAGLLVFVAIPARDDYGVRVRVGEAVGRAAPLQRAVVEFANKHKTWPSKNSDIGLPPPSRGLPSKDLEFDRQRIKAITLGEGGIITITFSAGPGYCRRCSNIENSSVILKPGMHDGSVSWTCTSEDMDPRYLPVMCRQ